MYKKSYLSGNNKIKSEKADKNISILVATLVLLYYPVLNFVNKITNFFAPNTPFDTILVYMILAVLILKALAPLVGRTLNIIFLSLTLFFLLFLTSAALFPANQPQIIHYLEKISYGVYPFLIIGFAIKDYSLLLSYLKKLVPYAVISGLMIYAINIVTHQVMSADDLALSYALLPAVIVSAYFSLKNWKSLYTLLAISGFLLLLSFGARGPVICLLSYIAFYVLSHIKSKGVFAVTILSSAVLVWLILSERMTYFLTWLSGIYSGLGISTRVFDYLLASNYLDLNGRESLMGTIINSIMERPIIGYGILGDRTILQSYIEGSGELGLYVHNMALELWCQFGIILGTGLFVYFSYILIKSLIINMGSAKGDFLFMIVPMAVVKLLMSSSYLEEPYFFLLTGICIKAVLEYNKAKRERIFNLKTRTFFTHNRLRENR